MLNQTTIKWHATHIPAVFPPRQASQNAKLNGHQPQADPGEGVRSPTRLAIQIHFFLSNEHAKILWITF